MRRIGLTTIAVVLPLVALATAARAQLAGIPVYFTPKGGTGVGVAVDAGFPSTDAGGGTAYGATGSFGTGPVTLKAMIGAYKGSNFLNTQTSFGAAISYRLFGGGLLPVAVAAQAGYGQLKNEFPTVPPTIPPSTTTATMTTIPVGIGIAFDPPLFPFKPWIAPRMDFQSQTGGGSSSSFHVSGGVDFNLLLGLGLHAAVDWGKLKSTNKSAIIIGVGAHFNFHVPMM